MAVAIHIKLDLRVDEFLVHQPQHLTYYFSGSLIFMSRLSHKWRQIRIFKTFSVLILLPHFLDGQMLKVKLNSEQQLGGVVLLDVEEPPLPKFLLAIDRQRQLDILQVRC
jgi:hypothetical protein